MSQEGKCPCCKGSGSLPAVRSGDGSMTTRCYECGGSGNAIEKYPVGSLTDGAIPRAKFGKTVDESIEERRRQLALVLVSERLIEMLMGFPPNARIVEVRPSRHMIGGGITAEFIVECGDFRVLEETEVIPQIIPTICERQDGSQGVERTIEWNYPGLSG